MSVKPNLAPVAVMGWGQKISYEPYGRELANLQRVRRLRARLRAWEKIMAQFESGAIYFGGLSISEMSPELGKNPTAK